MGPATGTNQSFCVEQLEQRRLLCSSLADGIAGHAPNAALADDANGAPAEVAGQNGTAGHVVAAFARSNGGMRGGRVVWGETAVVNGALVTTWAVVSKKSGTVMAAGATVPISLAQDMPARGTGPAGAFASLDFPAVVRNTTYFDHLEMHSQQNGHPAPPGSVNPDRNRVPHFDYHFYGIPEADVFQIPGAPPPLPLVSPDQLPAGYIQPGPSEPQMGRHSAPQWSLAEPGPLSTIVLAGYLPDASQMHFVEPMISREVLLEQQDFTLNVPMPQTFDRDTLYPTRSEVVFQGGAHHFIYSDFIDTDPTTPAAVTGQGGSTGPRTRSALLAAADARVPFRGSLQGTVERSPDPDNAARVLVEVDGSGHASRLGQFTFSAPHYVDTATRTATGNYLFTAANGDTVTAEFTGTATPTTTPGVLLIAETATITGGTGRFAGATGSFTIERMYDTLAGTTTGSFDGLLSSVITGTR